MDPSTQTNSVLMLNLPPSALGGINLLSFTTTPRFHGIKNLPPGWHFVFAASDTSFSVRQGGWFHVSNTSGSPQVFIKKWDAATEELISESSETEIMRWRANLGTIWRDGLMPFRQSADSRSGDFTEESTDWRQLTSRITPALLHRITNETTDHWSLTSASSAAQDVEDVLGLSQAESNIQMEKELRFLPINLKRTWREGATGRERTKAAQDRSWALGELIEKHCTGEDDSAREAQVLGELQFTFLMVLTLNNNSCLEQWKRLLGLVFTCRQAAQERISLFIEILQNLKVQLGHCKDMEGGLFDMNEDGGGFLKPLLRRFRKGLSEEEGIWKQDIIDELDDLQDYLKQEFGWDMDDSFVKRGLLELEDGERVELEVKGVDEDEETGEYAPTIVELSPSQMKELAGGAASHRPGHDPDSPDEEELELDDMDERF